MKAAAAVLAVLGLLVAGCGTQDGSNPAGSALPSQSTSLPASGDTNASTEQIQAAGLAPCPPSTGSGRAEKGLPDLTLDCLAEGPSVNLSGLTGKPYVVNIWASWCGPCRTEVPILTSVYDQARSQVGFLGIDMADSRAAALEFARVSAMKFPSVMDPDSKIRAGLGIAGVPTTLFVAADGTVAGRVNQITSETQLKDLIEQYLQVTL